MLASRMGGVNARPRLDRPCREGVPYLVTTAWHPEEAIMTKDLHSAPPSPPDPLEAGRSMARRLALLHMAYARTLVDALGDEAGQALIRRAIAAYGAHVGERVRRSVEALGQLDPGQLRRGDDVPPSLFPPALSRSTARRAAARAPARCCDPGGSMGGGPGRPLLRRRPGQDGGLHPPGPWCTRGDSPLATPTVSSPSARRRAGRVAGRRGYAPGTAEARRASWAAWRLVHSGAHPGGGA